MVFDLRVKMTKMNSLLGLYCNLKKEEEERNKTQVNVHGISVKLNIGFSEQMKFNMYKYIWFIQIFEL